MAADSNMSLHQGLVPSSFYNSHLVSFQSATTSNMTGMALESVSGSGAISSTAGMLLAGNTSMLRNASSVILSGGSAGNILRDTVPSLKHDIGLAVDWSFEEQAILRDGLVKYAKEPTIMKYIKIAASLHDKTVRDVALRCRWMTKKQNGKRRKPEDSYLGKKIKDRKEKMVDSFPMANINLVPSSNVPAYSQLMHQMTYSRFPSEVQIIDSATRNLLEENARVLSQITSNLATFKIQDNFDLFCHTRNNIATILASMSQMPGIMSRMPPLPVSVNEELVNIILPGTSQAVLFGTPSGIHLKQEPRC